MVVSVGGAAAMFHAGFSEYLEDTCDGTEWFLIGICELILVFLVLRPLESVIPVHAITDRRARWLDFLYTVLYRVDAFSVLVFFLIDPLLAKMTELLHLDGINPFNLENFLPGVTDKPLLTFPLYLLVLDFCEYWCTYCAGSTPIPSAIVTWWIMPSSR